MRKGFEKVQFIYINETDTVFNGYLKNSVEEFIFTDCDCQTCHFCKTFGSENAGIKIKIELVEILASKFLATAIKFGSDH